ncbi:MAG: hypothetical protein Q4G30_03675 [Actinomycetaceae bacterium]|nr:hypothetical protein [Actinomycetaceae bacterium]
MKLGKAICLGVLTAGAVAAIVVYSVPSLRAKAIAKKDQFLADFTSREGELRAALVPDDTRVEEAKITRGRHRNDSTEESSLEDEDMW